MKAFIHPRTAGYSVGLVNTVSRVDKVFSWASSRRNKNSELSYDAEFRLLSDASNSLTSPTKNSSLFGSHRAAMTMITSLSKMRKAQVRSLPSVDSYVSASQSYVQSPIYRLVRCFLFLCIFTSASFRIEILVFRIRICDVTLSSNWRFHLEFCGSLWLHCWRLSGLLEWRRWIEVQIM